ncbi:MAG: S41 family peptidase [Mobilicoccus sp.]|nr:S41 family peptidase [Mobilicoccus sp.]
MASTSRRAPSHRRRWWLMGCGGIVAVLLAGALVAVWVFGPYLGFWLIKPSPQRYAEYAIERMSNGYEAQGPAWDAARQAALDAAASAEDYADTHATLEAAVKVAGGRHSFFSATPLDEPGASAQMPSAQHEGGLTTVTLPEAGFTEPETAQRYADAIADGLSAEAASCGVVVDVRGNNGGTMWPMIAGLSPLLGDGPFMAFRHRGGQDVEATIDGGEVKISGSTQASIERTDRLDVPVAVLTDGMTASSAEAVVTAFRGQERFRTFGAPTAGYSSGNEVVTLPDGAYFAITTSVYVDRTGQVYGGPMTPDEEVAPERAPAAAQEWLRGRCG